MCTLSFKGLGYSKSFVKNYRSIKDMLVNNEESQIQVTFKDDSICIKCPHLIEEDNCVFQEKINKLDHRHAQVLKLVDQEILTWKQAKERIKLNMTKEKFHDSCDGCEWKKYGVCEEALHKLISP
jgi:hypothetical protein